MNELSIAPTSALSTNRTPGVYDPSVFQQLITISDNAPHEEIEQSLLMGIFGIFSLGVAVGLGIAIITYTFAL